MLYQIHIQFCKSLTHPLAALHPLVHTSRNARFLFAAQTLARKVIDTVVEAALDEVRIELHKLIHLAPLNDGLELALFGGGETVEQFESAFVQEQ
jgi:hypothetical protein